MKNFVRAYTALTIFVAGMCFSSVALAQQDPIALLDKVTSQVMVALKSNRAAIKANPNKAYSVVNKYILPHVDFVEMARWVAGRNAWKAASKKSRNDFVKQLETLVVRTYGSALSNYSDQTIEFLPLRGSIENKSRISVASKINQFGKQPITLDYRLVRKGQSWRVYDIIIEGVSLLKGYQAQFSDEIRVKGLDEVTKKIKEHNAEIHSQA